jgi:hypothetical protein
MATDTYYIEVGRIEEQVVPGKRLGRHIRFDSRSALYPVRETAWRELTKQLWTRHIPILDQGDLGSCTGNGETGNLGTTPLWDALPANHPVLDEKEAVKLYSEATKIDPYPGAYPPTDTGSDGLSVCKAAKADGLISGYLNAANVNAIGSALQAGPVVIGINWYDSFDEPDSNGLITISADASVRGGHEPMLRGVDPDNRQFFGDNSWGGSWGNKGSFLIGFDDMDRLLGEGGDCYQPLPLSGPAPTPTPTPTPPTPTPTPNPDADPVDQALAQAAAEWAYQRHVGLNEKVAKATQAWLQDHGFVS